MTFEFWDDQGWRPVPSDFMNIKNVLNTRVDQFVIWREGGVLKQNVDVEKEYFWPEAVPMVWSQASNAQLQKRLQEMSSAINNFWTGKFDLRRVECKGYDPACCRVPVVCDVSFKEVFDTDVSAIFITENFNRPSSRVWSMVNDTKDTALPDTTAIHEFGHLIGNPDEYEGVKTINPNINGDGAKKGIDSSSIMGSGTDIRRRHYNTIARALGWLVEQRTGKRFSFVPVDRMTKGTP